VPNLTGRKNKPKPSKALSSSNMIRNNNNGTHKIVSTHVASSEKLYFL